MNIETIYEICNQLKSVTTDVKWGNDLCFCIGEKMFLVSGLDDLPVGISFKTDEEGYNFFLEEEGCTSAPYLGRYMWIYLDNINRFSRVELEEVITKSYQLIASKLPEKHKQELGIVE